MSSKTVATPLPAWAAGENFDGVQLVQPGERALVVHGLKKPRDDGEQWTSVSLTRMGAKRHDTFSIDIDAAGAKLLRDLLIRLYGPGDRQ